ncbi:GGDEF domain-containing protein [Halodesulfovibrio marinisediminis]|uniref:diguanylate cyclase n=1 Tax=Halodesulfovibrio marinisediminis DSM 17456 TaxID=1121457 RepID=A0A1N6I4E4_9BACT|nr:GGDEF domain-containing protein [Halodesulfovibrio marinisediminis]SIO26898.1 diguanylate cyclase (GGDEF) domain-containing protein [Halodesulfovibrio marinisediminis DSM 17456]
MNGHTKKLMWGLGINTEDAEVIRHAAGDRFALSCFPVGVTPSVDQMEAEEPCLIWISKQGWDTLQALPSNARGHIDVASRILIMGGKYDLAELESLLECGFTEIIKPPITKERAREVILSAVETQNLYQDIMHMTREICLEREMLERKNDMLSFIVSFLEKVTQHLDPAEILRAAQTELVTLLPVSAINAICWSPQHSENLHAAIYVASNEKNSVSHAWAEILKIHAERLLGDKVVSSDMNYMGTVKTDIEPSSDTLLAIDLEHSGVSFGAVLVQCHEQPQLGKDQIQILRSAISHLSLGLNNAMLYTAAQHNADVDGLTRLYNRRHFDARIKEEDTRHRRYGHSLCLMIADIDNFKRINDTYGHLAGDAVLKEFSNILSTSLRTSDYIARFGGEEFAVLLPCTAASHAIALAERIRGQIEQHAFATDKGILNATASFGVSCIDIAHEEPPVEIIRRADAALYRAKDEGKNQVSILYPDNSLLVAGGYAT